MLRDAQRRRGRCEFRVIRGGKVPPHRLGAPLYSVSDVPWLRNGGNGGDSGGRRGTPLSIIPPSLPPPLAQCRRTVREHHPPLSSTPVHPSPLRLSLPPL